MGVGVGEGQRKKENLKQNSHRSQSSMQSSVPGL